MKTEFTTAQFQEFARRINCMGFDDFMDMYENVGFTGYNYINEKYEQKNCNFLSWFCDLSSEKVLEMFDFLGI